MDFGKLGILLVISAGLTAGLVLGAWEGEAATPAWASLTAIIGYIVGNGRAVVQSQSSSPVLMRRPKDGEVITIDGPYPAQSSSKGDGSDG